jgi:hypothetical protein
MASQRPPELAPLREQNLKAGDRIYVDASLPGTSSEPDSELAYQKGCGKGLYEQTRYWLPLTRGAIGVPKAIWRIRAKIRWLPSAISPGFTKNKRLAWGKLHISEEAFDPARGEQYNQG